MYVQDGLYNRNVWKPYQTSLIQRATFTELSGFNTCSVLSHAADAHWLQLSALSPVTSGAGAGRGEKLPEKWQSHRVKGALRWWYTGQLCEQCCRGNWCSLGHFPIDTGLQIFIWRTLIISGKLIAIIQLEHQESVMWLASNFAQKKLPHISSQPPILAHRVGKQSRRPQTDGHWYHWDGGGHDPLWTWEVCVRLWPDYSCLKNETCQDNLIELVFRRLCFFLENVECSTFSYTQEKMLNSSCFGLGTYQSG